MEANRELETVSPNIVVGLTRFLYKVYAAYELPRPISSTDDRGRTLTWVKGDKDYQLRITKDGEFSMKDLDGSIFDIDPNAEHLDSRVRSIFIDLDNYHNPE